MTEEWRPVVGLEGAYEVSDQGRVRSLDRVIVRSNGTTRRYEGQILKCPPGRDGRPFAAFGRGDRGKRVQRVVLEAFVGPAPEGAVCCHNDGDPQNNRLNNLRWNSMSENQRDAVRHGTHWNARKTHCRSGHELVDGNIKIRLRNGSARRECRACWVNKKPAEEGQR